MAVTRHRAGPLRALLVVAATLGCVTSGTGELMRNDIARLRERVEKMERQGVEADVNMTRLRAILDEATSLLARNNADVGARVQKAEMDIGAINGKLEEAKHIIEQLQKKQTEDGERLAALDQGQQKIVDRVAPAMAEDRETLWKQAQERMAGGMREDSRRFFRGFIQRFPQDPRAPQAHLEIGRSYALEGKHLQAAPEYQRVLEGYSKSPEVADAMWLMGQSYIDLKFCTEARALLTELLRRYPRSAHASEARTRLRDLQRMMRDKRACAS